MQKNKFNAFDENNVPDSSKILLSLDENSELESFLDQSQRDSQKIAMAKSW